MVAVSLKKKKFFPKSKNIDKIVNISDSFNVIVSDLSPNITGIWELDSERIYDYNKRVLYYAKKLLNKNGILVMKTFEGRTLNKIISLVKKYFKYVKIYKPKASRKRSAEIYLICYRLERSNRISNKSL